MQAGVNKIQYSLNLRGKLVKFHRPAVMGILNITPDSFFNESRISSEDALIKKIEQMMADGATFIDIGAASTKPGSKLIQSGDEIARLKPFEKIFESYSQKVILSIDTYNAATAQFSMDCGFSVINDVSAGDISPGMPEIARRHQCPYIIMHMQNRPESMQYQPHYENVSREVIQFLAQKKKALLDKGLTDIIIDPGFGFGKTLEHNYELLRKLDVFSILESPLLAGLSRKSMVNKVLGIGANEALNGTTVLNTIALMKGASILRVHDVKEAVQAVQLFEVYQQIPTLGGE
jgi:dihydropteroate synthase